MTLSLRNVGSRLLRSLAMIDRFVLALAAAIGVAAILPCRDSTATVLHWLGLGAISSLFFLQGARLSRAAVINGITHWRLHTLIGLTTFVLFPLLGLSLWSLQPQLLPPLIWLGVLYVCTLPSTVQSSIALTSIAGGNVAGAVCSATLSNIVGIVLTPVVFGALSSMRNSGHVDPRGILWVVVQLLVPFAAGQLLRPRIGAWAERNRPLLALTDRGSILLVNYTAFSAAVVNGIWRQVPPTTLMTILFVVGVLVSGSLLLIRYVAKGLGFDYADTVAAMLCGSQKSLVSGLPIANVLFSSEIIGPVLLPAMMYYPLQLVVCGVLAKRASGDATHRASREIVATPTL
jgi:sodium/bile acid cotransporter 7